MFTYTGEALARNDLPSLSLNLPKRAAPFPDSKAGPFYRNLLPEQAYRRLIASAARLAPENDLGLLGAIGAECPGAVSIWPEGTTPPPADDCSPLSDAALMALFDVTDRGPLANAVTRGRISLPGVQEKLALLRTPEGQWYQPHSGAVTTHILKQADATFPNLLENELYCMTLRGSGRFAGRALRSRRANDRGALH